MAKDEPIIEIEDNADPVSNENIDYYPPVAVYVNDNDDIECLPGYRFNPFDHELIVHYLLRKVNKQRLPHNKIKEVELYKYNPEEITNQGLVEKEWYFFTPRDRKYKNGNRPNRAAGDGYWKATGADKKVSYKGEIVGYRKALVFYQGKAPKGDKTNWIMHEFRVQSPTERARTHDGDMRLDDWVLCRIYKKDDKVKKAPRQNHTVENSQSEENSPIRVPGEKSPATTAIQFPTPVTTNICRDVMESHLPCRIPANPFSFSDASLPNNLLFSPSLAVDSPQPLNDDAYDLPLFPNQFESYNQDEFNNISMDSLDDFSSLSNYKQNYEYVSTNNFRNDFVVFPNARKNNPGLPNNSLVVTSQSVASSPAGHSST
ncbi:hypothetical protein DCAR_0206015 [Daucus carota subsp. sativus]|uniref:NAC domain-containing protein n=1 Tax=Daucus carota subsp. sativus TaxID=79200 RepID=A0AAF0WBC8_DAUCS|nr:hypothetical protein DCAR_0206015 [Daucus carota subsp. sativus]